MNAGIQLARRERLAGRRGLSSAFTLIELMIVITIILILIGIAAGNYRSSITRAREATLRQDLQVMREAIDNYTLDKEAAPQSLEDLKNANYLREIPLDPISHAQDWVPVYGDTVMSADQSSTGVTDVHSGSSATSPFDGTAYSSW
jgi:general secretion pathway protein G